MENIPLSVLQISQDWGTETDTTGTIKEEKA